jgi:hypothetical protein
MSNLYKVTKIEGKGLGCVAISDIKKGSLILKENPQLYIESEEVKWSSGWIKSLMTSFNEMTETDQHEYMILHNKFNNFQNFQNTDFIRNCKEIHDTIIEDVKLEIGKIEQNTEKAEEILKIFGIYCTNSFEDGISIKVSRFNHSCQHNADFTNVNGQLQLRAIGSIKAGKEININYLDEFAGFRNRKYRQQNLFDGWDFFCFCDLCVNDVDIDAESFEDFIQEAEKLTIERQSAFQAGISLGAQYYSLENCKKEILCYKQLYKVGKDQKIQPYFLFRMLDKGFDAATTGYQLYRATDFKIDAMTFAKEVENFGNILGNDIGNRGIPNFYEKVYQAVIDKAGY